MKIFVSLLFGLIMPIVCYWLISLVTRLSNGSSSYELLPMNFYLYSYPILFVVSAFCKYRELVKKEERKEAEEEEQQKKEELEEKMRQYLDKKIREEGKDE